MNYDVETCGFVISVRRILPQNENLGVNFVGSNVCSVTRSWFSPCWSRFPCRSDRNKQQKFD